MVTACTSGPSPPSPTMPSLPPTPPSHLEPQNPCLTFRLPPCLTLPRSPSPRPGCGTLTSHTGGTDEAGLPGQDNLKCPKLADPPPKLRSELNFVDSIPFDASITLNTLRCPSRCRQNSAPLTGIEDPGWRSCSSKELDVEHWPSAFFSLAGPQIGCHPSVCARPCSWIQSHRVGHSVQRPSFETPSWPCRRRNQELFPSRLRRCFQGRAAMAQRGQSCEERSRRRLAPLQYDLASPMPGFVPLSQIRVPWRLDSTVGRTMAESLRGNHTRLAAITRHGTRSESSHIGKPIAHYPLPGLEGPCAASFLAAFSGRSVAKA